MTQVVRPGNQVLGFTYDGAGRVKTSTQPGRTTTYGYGPQTGNLTSVAAGGERVEYGYDGVLLTRATVSGAAPGVIESAYDDELRLASETIGGESVARDYDDDGLPIAIGDLELEHDPANGLLDTLGAGGSATTIGRNAEGEPESLVTRQGAATSYREDYERDDLGRITGKTETRGTATQWEYGFDGSGRLETVQRGGSEVARYEYDANGNRTKVTRGATTVTSTYDDQDRLLSSDDGRTYAYTASGALRTKTVGGATTTYDYDATGALTGVTLPGGAQLGYTVDAGGRRVAETGGASQRRFLYGRGLGPVAELNATGTGVKSRFIYATHSNVPDLMIRGDKTYRIVTNQLGSPMAVVDVATGDVVQELDYDEFGRVTRDTNPEFQPFGFAGGLWDRETGLVRFGARDYDPETGRFTAPDPARLRGRQHEPLRLRAQRPGEHHRPERPGPGHDPGPRVHRVRPVQDRQVADERVRRVADRRRRAGPGHRRGVHPVRHRRRRRGAQGQRGHLPDRHAGRALHRPVQQHRPAHDRACPGHALHPGATRRRVPHGGPGRQDPARDRRTASDRPRHRRRRRILGQGAQ